MPYASQSDIQDLKDLLYEQHTRILKLELDVQELMKMVTKLDEMVTRNKTLGRLK